MASIEQDAVGRLATVRLLPPGESEDQIVADLLFASSGIEPEIVEAAQPLEIFPGLTVPVARTVAGRRSDMPGAGARPPS